MKHPPHQRPQPRGRRSSKGVAAAAVIAVTSGLLAACSTGSSSGTPELVWYTNPDAGGQAKVAENCTTNDYTISTQVLPQDAGQQRIQLARRLAAGDTGIDLMSLDPPYTAEFANAGYLAPIPADSQARSRSSPSTGATGGDLERRARRRAVLVQHAGALVPQVVRREGRPRHEQAGHLGPDHRRRRQERRHGRGAGQQVRGLRRLDQRPDRGRRRRHRQRHREGRRRQHRRSTPTPARRPPRSSSSWPAPRPRRRTCRSPTRAPPAAAFGSDQGAFMVNWTFIWTNYDDDPARASRRTSASPATRRRSQGKESEPPYGGIGIGVSEYSTHRDEAMQAVECITTPRTRA